MLIVGMVACTVHTDQSVRTTQPWPRTSSGITEQTGALMKGFIKTLDKHPPHYFTVHPFHISWQGYVEINCHFSCLSLFLFLLNCILGNQFRHRSIWQPVDETQTDDSQSTGLHSTPTWQLKTFPKLKPKHQNFTLCGEGSEKSYISEMHFSKSAFICVYFFVPMFVQGGFFRNGWFDLVIGRNQEGEGVKCQE